MSQIPFYLKKGDSIAMVATARKVSETEMEPAIKKFQSWGLKVQLGRNLFKDQNQFAGSDEDRIADFQKALDDDTIKAIIVARGGYGTVRIIDNLDFSIFKNNPKWIVGYSDVTVLHAHIHQNYAIETLHATMPINFLPDGSDNNAILSLKKALFGENLTYQIECHKLNVEGKSEGAVVGGNLSLLYALGGSNSVIDTKGKILFIEDLDEYLYHIDRMMINLKRSGKLKNLAGLIVGGMTEMKDNTIPFGKNAYEIIADTIKEYQFPVCFGFPAGHMEDNRALILGRKIRLEVLSNKVNVVFY
jgi:muramoyltetrapeptide carboxypeptidase